MPKSKPVRLPQLPSHEGCTRCVYHEGCQNVGLPTLWESRSLPPGNHPAIVCVGASPGHQEDKYGEVWAGPAGHLLKTVYLDTIDKYDSISIYYTNVVRCHGGLGDPKPPKAVVSACLPYTKRDLMWIGETHEKVVILALGSPACQALFDKKLGTAARTLNGREISLDLTE